MRDAVLDATASLVAEVGYGALTMDAVAGRAGVNKSTVYRWWPTKPDLLRDAMLREADALVAMPDTGDVAADLRDFLLAIARGVSSPTGHALLLATVRDPAESAGFVASRRAFWNQRLAPAIARLEQAQVAGQVDDAIDPALLAESLVAPIHFRVLLRGEPVDAAFIDGLLRLYRLDRGASPATARRRSGKR